MVDMEKLLQVYFRTPGKRKRGTQNGDDKTEYQSALKSIKKVYKDASRETQTTYADKLLRASMYQLQRKVSAKEMLPRIQKLVAEVFDRSSIFRAHVAKQVGPLYDAMLRVAEGILMRHRSTQLEQNADVNRILALVEAWEDKFGDKYPPLIAASDGLKQRGYQFPHVRKKKEEQEAKDLAIAQHQTRVMEAKREQTRKEMASRVPEMEQLLVEMNHIFNMIVPTLDVFDRQWETSHASVEDFEGDNNDGEDDIEWEDVGESKEYEEGEDDTAEMEMDDIVEAYGLGHSSYQLTIEVPTNIGERSGDNEVLFKHLEDGVKSIRKRYLPLVDDWLLHLRSTRDPNLTVIRRRVRDLQKRLHVAIQKYNDLLPVEDEQKPDRVQSSVVSLPLGSYQPPLKKGKKS